MNFLITGQLGSGKDTVASFIPNVLRVSFAKPVKEVAKLIRLRDIDGAYRIMNELFVGKCPLSMRQTLECFTQIPKTEEKDRVLLQQLGTNWARTWDADVWLRGLRNTLKPENAYIITDCRFPNEFEAFADFTRIYVDATPETRKERVLKRDGNWKDEWDLHPSEIYIPSFRDQCDFVLDNNGSIDNLKSQVNMLSRRCLQ